MNSAARAPGALEQLGPVGLASDDAVPPPEDRTEAASPLEVRRNGAAAGVVGVLASAVAIAWLGRATASNALLDWALVGAMALVAVAYLRAALDARIPLLIADAQGVRVRLGRGWWGLPWGAVHELEHQPRRGILRDGRLAIMPRDPERFLAELDRGGRRQARLAQRLYGAPLGVPLGPSTRLVGAEEDLVAQLVGLADPSVRVVDVPARTPRSAAAEDAGPEPADDAGPAGPSMTTDVGARPGVSPSPESPEAPGDAEESAPRVRDPRLLLARAIGGLSRQRIRRQVLVDQDPDDQDPDDQDPDDQDPDDQDRLDEDRLDEETDSTEATDERGRDEADVLTAAAAAQIAEEVRVVGRLPEEEGSRWTDRVRPIARLGQPVEPLVVDDFQVEPATDPVIGPDVAAARTRLGLSVDQLAERTRIRPHVIESIEVDDFAPCGGDFYARGHLRTLARVLGIDVAPLLARYAERYAHAPVDARRVFEAELASAGARARSPRGRGGPNWSVLVAALMAVVLCWSVAQLMLDAPPDVRPPTPTLRNGSAGVDNGTARDAEPVPVLIGAVQGGATIEVRDGNGETVFSGDVAYGESRALQVVPPVQVSSDDAGAVEVTVAGDWRGRMGRLGESATQTYPVDG